MSAAEKVSHEEVIAHQHARLHAAQLRRLCPTRVRVGESGQVEIQPAVYCDRDLSRWRLIPSTLFRGVIR